ncbi:MAG: PLP-dependent transferase, partial [Bosea sp. (in: a-proteobacteria)]
IVDAGRFDWAKDKRFPLISEPWEDYDDVVLPEVQPRSAFAAACRLIGLRELGPGLSPTNAFLILTGIETLALRMERHSTNALGVARYLETHPAVASVSYPGLPSHPQHNLAKALCPNGLGSVFQVTLKGGEAAANAALSRLKLFSHLVNIGETRSLVAHPATTTHRNASPELRAALGIAGGTLRLSIGLEDEADLVADLAQALA